MTFREQWVQRPQNLWVRKALFQVHLWVGIGIGIYIFIISVSGSVLVYRRELSRAFTPAPVILAGSNQRLTPDELKQSAQRVYPGYSVTDVFERKRPDQAAVVSLQRGKKEIDRLFNLYTGADIGDVTTPEFRILSWFVDLHDNLLAGTTGHFINFFGGILVTLLSATGAIIWWPGIKRWRRSLTVDPKAQFQRFNWELHSAFGIWSLVPIFLWGVSGIYLAWPEPFHALLDYLEPAPPPGKQLRVGDYILFWIAQLHFGRFSGWYVKALWAAMGLVPVVLFTTGALMWWNRVLRKRVREWS